MRNEPVKELNGFKLYIERDDDPQNPRTEWDNACTMAFFHKRYDLGDKDAGFKSSEFDGWDHMEAHIKLSGAIAITTVYMYDHSGLTISTSPFGCPWDSGRIGFAFVTKAQADRECPFKSRKARLKWARAVVESEVAVYDKYLSGDLYDYYIQDSSGDVVESCSGFYGEEDVKSEGLSMLEYLVKHQQKEKAS